MQHPPLQISYSLANIENAINKLWQYAHQYRVWLLQGEMGAGKTTLVHTLCKTIGVKDTVSSPTFALINEYHFLLHNRDEVIYHMDWYRLRDAEEAIGAGIEDILLKPQGYCLIEWPQKAASLLPKKYASIEISVLSQDERQIICILHS